jgi:hypothetical protein
MFPEEQWNWSYISKNINITEQFIEENYEKPWDWGSLSKNIKIGKNFIEKHMDWPWDWYVMTVNPNMDFQFVKKYFPKKCLTDNVFSNMNVFTNLGTLIKLINKHNMGCLLKNPYLTLDILDNFIVKHFPIKEWIPVAWQAIANNPVITLEWLNYLSIEDYSIKNDVLISLCNNISIKPEWIKSFPKLYWDFSKISSNTGITDEFLDQFPLKDWDFDKLNKNPSINVTALEKWYVSTYEHRNRRRGLLELHEDDEWIHKISSNPNITFGFMERYYDKLDLDAICHNKFTWMNNFLKKKKEKYYIWFLEKYLNVPDDLKKNIIEMMRYGEESENNFQNFMC